ncbi:MAG: 50S ribosomal protein L29 [Candidatus Nealsonbacteria bacterium]|nr:50S ribosomal protein L29 [Candidatus Nealsonbacteria bacterium]
MKITELRQKSKEELKKMLEEWQEKLRALYFDLKAGKLKNVREVRTAKKDIAKILTLLNSKPQK